MIILYCIVSFIIGVFVKTRTISKITTVRKTNMIKIHALLDVLENEAKELHKEKKEDITYVINRIRYYL